MTEDHSAALSALPPGFYGLAVEDPIAVDETIMALAGGGLFGLATCGQDVASTTTNVFYWCAEAQSYFSLDNLYDELALGLRWHGTTECAADAEISRVLRAVGLETLIPTAKVLSPLELSGGQQQRLLVAVIITRRPSDVLAVNPLIYVEKTDRAHLLQMVVESVRARNGRIVLPLDDCVSCGFMPTHRVRLTDSQFQATLCGLPRLDTPIPTDRGSREVRHCGTPILTLRALRYVYPSARVGVRVSECTLYLGRTYVVCGPNGGGKSSLVRLLTQDARIPPSSCFEFQGRRIQNPFRELVRPKSIAFSLQDPNLHLSAGTVASFIETVDPSMVTSFGIAQYMDTDLLGAPLWVRQAVVLLTAMTSPATMYILDEPLDGITWPVCGRAALDVFRASILAHKTILLVTHNPALAASVATDYVWVEDGTVNTPLPAYQTEQFPKALRSWLG